MSNRRAIWSVLLFAIFISAGCSPSRPKREAIFGFYQPTDGCIFTYFAIDYDEVGPFYSRLAHVNKDGSYSLIRADNRRIRTTAGELSAETFSELKKWSNECPREYRTKDGRAEFSNYSDVRIIPPEPVDQFCKEVFPE